jgi:hypothetical protein
LFHQVSDKRLARERRAEVTLSPSGGGSTKVRPKDRNRKEPRYEGVFGPNNAERQGEERLAATELEDQEAKSAARPTRREDPDPEKKEPKGTRFKGQSK